MEKRLFVQLNGNRKVIGILRGYDVRLPTTYLAFFTLLNAWVDEYYTRDKSWRVNIWSEEMLMLFLHRSS